MSNSISGNISDPNNIALANARVNLRTPVSTLAPTQFTYSDASGNYSFSGLFPGVYQLTATSDGVIFRHAQLVTIVGSDYQNVNFFASALNSSNSGNVVPPVIVPIPPSPVTAQLGLAAAYSLLAAAGVSNSGNTIVTGGNVGTTGATITGFPPGVVTPPNTIDNTDATAAQSAALSAYNFYSALASIDTAYSADSGVIGFGSTCGSL